MLRERSRVFIGQMRVSYFHKYNYSRSDICCAFIAAEGVNLLTVVLRSGEAPTLTRPQMHRVMRAHKAHAEYLRNRSELADSDDDDGPQDDDAWLYEDLTILAKLYSQLREKEQIIELIFEVGYITSRQHL